MFALHARNRGLNDILAMAQVIRDSVDTDPDGWRRFLEIYVAGLRAS